MVRRVLSAVTAVLAVLCLAASAAHAAIWKTPAEIDARPMSGTAWTVLKSWADKSFGALPIISDQTSDRDQAVYAAALVYERLNRVDSTAASGYRAKVRGEIARAITNGDECGPLTSGSKHLAMGRNLPGYVFAADIIGLPVDDPALNSRFSTWILGIRNAPCGNSSESLVRHSDRTNNHGTMANGARSAIDAYLGDTADLAHANRILKGWMGDRSARAWPITNFHGVMAGSGSWMCDKSNPRPVNPPNCFVQGRNVDGAQPQEQSRCGAFKWPPCYTGYPWGGQGGSLVAAEVQRRNGYPGIFLEQTSALRRTMNFIYRLSAEASSAWYDRGRGDESWQPWLVNRIYGTAYPAYVSSRVGHNNAFEAWFG